jgi:ATP-dependent Lon protease
VILPRRNGADLEELPPEVRAALDIVLVDHMDEVLRAALVAESPEAAAAA